MNDPIISKLTSSKVPVAWKESLPFPFVVFVNWERKVLQSACDPLLRIILGSFLFQSWSGLRWADMQRLSPGQLLFDLKAVRGCAWKSKTSHRGQPFGLLACGFLSHGSNSWLSMFLRSLDEIFANHADSDQDFLLPRIFMQNDSLRLQIPLVPMTYTDSLFYIRRYINCPWKASQPFSFDVSSYTVHGLKSTMLSWGAQIPEIPEEWRRLQGHHRPQQQSVRLYSRDDVHLQLQFQTKLIQRIQQDFRPCTPIHRGSQQPAVEPSIPALERFRKDECGAPWKFFPFNKSQPMEEPLDLEVMVNQLQPEEDEPSSHSDAGSSDSEDRPLDSHNSNHADKPMDKFILGHLKAVVHIIPDWLQESDHPTLKTACGRAFQRNRVTIVDTLVPPLVMCNHGACRHIWSQQ